MAVKKRAATRKRKAGGKRASKRPKSGRKAGQEPQTRQPGRPTKLTMKVRDKVVNAIRAGNYPEVAAQYAGIARSTFYRWMEKGALEEVLPETDRSQFWEFWDTVTRAEAEAEVGAVTQLADHGKRDTRATVEFLRRRYRERWGVEIHEIRPPGEGERVGLDAIRALLTEEEKAALEADLAKAKEGTQ